MNRSVILIAFTALAFLSSTQSQAEVKVAWERNDPTAATAKFQFRKIPAPSKTDAATNAQFRIVDGREDAYSGGLDMLHDGQLPSDGDQPDSNFFFDAGTAGGRITVDLGSRTKIQQINTYSWHHSARGPQVYRV